ncbi:MAG: hypothetical protein GY898_17230 [Proteobacteria bacterium]|nr:hypothetical protein [Pseudomonadota bacterium]
MRTTTLLACTALFLIGCVDPAPPASELPTEDDVEEPTPEDGDPLDDDDTVGDDDDDDDVPIGGVLTVHCAELNLGSVEVSGWPLATTWVTFRNRGDAALTVELDLVEAGPSVPGFSWELAPEDTSFVLEPDAWQSFEVTFTPPVGGDYSLTLEGHHDGSNPSPQELTLTGLGLGPTPEVEFDCSDSTDDDGDGDIDCDDEACFSAPECSTIDFCCVMGDSTTSTACVDATATACTCATDSWCCSTSGGWDASCVDLYVACGAGTCGG